MIIPSGGCDAMHAAMSYEALRRERDELKAALAKVTAERDALVEIVKQSVDACESCRNKKLMAWEICEGLCMDCPMSKECLCGNCVGGSNFEFAGVKEESRWTCWKQLNTPKKAIKPKADSTLYNMKKSELIEYIRCLENNYNAAVWFNENQARYIESLGLLKDGDSNGR